MEGGRADTSDTAKYLFGFVQMRRRRLLEQKTGVTPILSRTRTLFLQVLGSEGFVAVYRGERAPTASLFLGNHHVIKRPASIYFFILTVARLANNAIIIVFVVARLCNSGNTRSLPPPAIVVVPQTMIRPRNYHVSQSWRDWTPAGKWAPLFPF
jgi:hypothetical protein